MRRDPMGWIPVVTLALAVGAGFGLAAAGLGTPTDEVLLTSESEEEIAGDADAADDADDAGVHGGPIERFHDTGSCDLVDVSTLPGNWTHGDYVSAVADLEDPALVPVAARSDCGKPMVAVNKGGGPPEHAGKGGPAPWATPGGRGD